MRDNLVRRILKPFSVLPACYLRHLLAWKRIPIDRAVCNPAAAAVRIVEDVVVLHIGPARVFGVLLLHID